jgi:di/tricarboxylate transporter
MRIPDAETILNGEDILWFAGDMNGMQTLRRIPGLVSQENQVEKLKHVRKTDRRLVQAVISQGSSLVGRCVRDTHFRTRYDAVIIAVQRSGGRIQARIGDIVLEAGDVLLLDTSTSFLLDHKSDPTFALISEIEDSAPPQFDKLLPSLGTAVVMIAVFVAGALDLFVAALLASGVMLATGCLTQEQARAAVKWDVIVTIAAAFGISAAMEQSGVAAGIASTLVSAGNGMGTGKPGILVAVYLATVVLCNIVGNNAAAALMYPIAAGAAEKQGIDNVQMSYLLMLAASASFMSPFGYQTNLMVYGPGGYVFANFLKFGAPMQVVQLIVSVSVVLLDSKWWIGWIVGFGAILTIYLTRLVVPIIRKRRDAARGGSTDSRLDPIQEVL